MNKYLITKKWSLLGLVFVAGALYAQSNSENYVYSKTYLADPTTTNAKTSETVTYFDGLGRAKQIVNIKATPSGKDMVTPVTYDGFGRQTKNILPTPINTLNGNIHSGVTNENTANSYYGVSNAYSEKELEKSPLDRVLQQANPGDAWKLGAGHTQAFSYGTNAANEVIKFVTTTSTSTVSNVTTISTALPTGSLGFYGLGRFYKNTITDEDGNPVTQFTNGRGQTILIRRTDGTQNIDTYYVYNDYGQKAFVIPPKAVQQIVQNANKVTADILNTLCYQYRYDGQGREVEKKLPGKGWELTIYDKQDRAVLYQDAVLGTVNNNFGSKGWIFTKYDEFNRVVYTGFFSSTATRQSLQNTLNTLTTNTSNNEKRTSTFFNQQGIDIYYDKLAYPTSNFVVLSVNYYDSYPRDAPSVIPEKILDQYVLLATFGTGNTTSTKSLKTASYLKNIEDDKWTKTYHYYDFKGRQIATKTTNHLEGYTNKESKLDFSGLATESYTYHKRTPTETEVKIKERFVYDNGNRLLKQYHQVDSKPEELLVENTYNEIGQLINKKTGNTTGTSLQSIDLTYNIRGWLTKVNNPANLNGKLFGYEIRYQNPIYSSVSTGKYNGNIAEMDWSNANNGIFRRYNYKYDGLDRLKDGIYSEPNTTTPQNNYYNESMTYDVNGNIQSLKRNMLIQNLGTQVMDDLSYIYAGNRLSSVKESAGNYIGYPDSSQNPISYDDNGNMTDHVDRGILKIDYNYLNLPDYVKFDKTYLPRDLNPGVLDYNVNTRYLYNAEGVKLRKVYTYGSGRGQMETVEKTDYLDGFQYTNDKLSFVPTSEGYFDFVQNKYIYNYTDQVGNIRLAYYKDASGNPKIDRVTDYYPFGLEFGDYLGTSLSISPNYKYSSQGQEKQMETGWSSYKWRNYDSAMGRFFNVDPLSEKYAYQSHYNFAENRVIDGRELEGLEWVKSTKLNDNGTKTYTLSATINLINRSQSLTPEGVETFKTNFLSQMKESFGGNMNNGDKIEVGNINFTDKGSYTIALTDQISTEQSSKELDNGSEIKGYTFGENGNSQVNYMEAVVSGKMTPTYATHEVGHSLGLKHQDDKSNPISPKQIGTDNLMSAPQWKIAKQTIPEQRQIIIQNIPDEKNKN